MSRGKRKMFKGSDSVHETLILSAKSAKSRFELSDLIFQIKKYRHWKHDHLSFSDCCKERLGIGKTGTYKLLKVAEFMGTLNGDEKNKIRSFSHAVELSKGQESKWAPRVKSLFDPEGRTIFQVYVLRCRTSGYVKIGVTCRLEKRVKDIQMMCPTTLDVFRVFTVFESVSVKSEKFLHNKFAEYRKHGEWFDLPESELEWIKSADESLIHEN